MTLRSVSSTGQPENPMLAAARAYAERGWPVFPCVPGAKHPMTPNGFHDATTDILQIKRWWEKTPDANIGLAMGIASNLVCVDVDISDGKEGADSLMDVKPTGWETLTSVTWSGGWHYIFQHPGGMPVQSRVNVRPGIDIRADGGYIIAPPSVVKGKAYRWQNNLEPIAMDQAALSLVQRRVEADIEIPDSEPLALPPARVERIQAALGHVDAHPYTDWIRIGMALYEMTGGSEEGFRLWDAWSQTADNYQAGEMTKRWRSFASSRGDKITGQTLWKIATEQGFTDTGPVLTFNPDAAPSILPPTITQFLEFSFPPDDPILGPFNANQIANLIGPTGLGKSNLMLYILNAMACGKDILGWKSHKKVPVLYVDGEMGGTQLQERFKHYDWTGGDVRVVNAINWCSRNKLGQPNLSTEEWQQRIIDWAPEGGVTSLDNLMSLVHKPGVSLSSDEFWRAVTPLNLALRAKGCSVIWVDHVNAEGKIFGTKTKEWQSDLVLTLMNNEKTELYEEKPGTAFTLSFTKVRGERGSDHQSLDVELAPDQFAGFEWKHQSRKAAELDVARELRADGLTQRQIAEEMKISLGKVNKLLKGNKNALTYKGN